MNTMRGFSLVELLIAMCVSGVTMVSAYSVYVVQQRHYGNQQSVLTARQNLRGALVVMEQEIRMVGYDPEDSGLFGIVDVRRYDVEKGSQLNADGEPALFYTIDVNEDGDLEGRNQKDRRKNNREHPKFRIGDVHKDGRLCLTWDNGSGRRPLAENIRAMGLAYAIDGDNDGRLDAGSGGTIWAVDSDNDNWLDTNLDSNQDGIIDPADDTNHDRRIDWADGGKLDPPIGLRHIRGVRVWLLAVAKRPLVGDGPDHDLVVGDRVMSAVRDERRCFVMETTIMCRNLIDKSVLVE